MKKDWTGKMKILIAGLGSVGRRHLRNLVSLGEHDILLYRTHQSTLPDEELSTYPVETDLTAALAQIPDAVIIANPTALHLDVAIPAALAGYHILLEKPISDTLERVDELQFAVQASGARVLVGFQYRYHPGLKQAAEILASGEIGRPLSVRAHWGEYLPNWHPWEDYRKSYAARKDLGGGVVLTLTHPMDYLRMLFGEVDALWALTAQINDLEIDVEDTAEIGLRFASGVMGSVHLDYNQQPGRHQLEIICTLGTIRWDNAGEALAVYSAEKDKWQTTPLPENFERDDLFRAQIAHFLEVVQDKAEPLCSLDDGIWAQKLANAVHDSAAKEKLIRFDQ
jgi:predicted dehydrogenase